MLAIAPGAKLSATIAAFSAALQRRRRGVPVRTSTRRKLCPSIGKLLGKPASLPPLNEAGSSVRPQPRQDGDSTPLTNKIRPIHVERTVADAGTLAAALENDTSLMVNAQFALNVAFSYLGLSLTEELIEQFLYILTYRSTDPNALIFIF